MIEFSCPKCGRGMRVSNEHAGKKGKCKDCGSTIAVPGNNASSANPARPARTGPSTTKEVELYSRHPSMIRNHSIWFAICLLLIFAYGIGLLILLIWYGKIVERRLIVTNFRTTLREGFFSKKITEVMHSDVRNVQIKQSMLQRVFQVGEIAISSAGQGDIEIKISGIPHPYQVKKIIDEARMIAHHS